MHSMHDVQASYEWCMMATVTVMAMTHEYDDNGDDDGDDDDDDDLACMHDMNA